MVIQRLELSTTNMQFSFKLSPLSTQINNFKRPIFVVLLGNLISIFTCPFVCKGFISKNSSKKIQGRIKKYSKYRQMKLLPQSADRFLSIGWVSMSKSFSLRKSLNHLNKKKQEGTLRMLFFFTLAWSLFDSKIGWYSGDDFFTSLDIKFYCLKSRFSTEIDFKGNQLCFITLQVTKWSSCGYPKRMHHVK